MNLHRRHILNDLGLAIAVTDNGRFDVADRQRGWTFAGRAGGELTRLTDLRGRDRAGPFRGIEFDFKGPRDAARHAAIRLYDRRRVVLFELTFVDAGTVDEAFPALSQYPRPLHHLTFTGIFGRFSFRRFGPDGPWVFFDGDANTFIMSAAAHFMNARLSRGPRGQLRSGIIAESRQIPAGFVHRTVLVMEPGINRAFDTWGRFLTDFAGKKRPTNDADAGLKYLGYWTDHGARYYYRAARGQDYPATLLAVRDAFRKAGLHLGYLQLDSWFYPKGRHGRWRNVREGTYRYEAAKELFPQGLKAFQRKIGLPLMMHNRWIDARSPDRRKFAVSGNVSVDPRLWRKWMRYLRAAGGAIYEQDWLSGPALPERDLVSGERFMDLMAAAARREGITLQYSMPLPRHFLQGSKYPNLTTIRPSGDRFKRQHWKSFVFNSRLATALGIWPWADVFKSGETANLLLATLSGGMVGVGDGIGAIDRESLRRAVRADGVIVKPDTSLTPLDQAYIAQARDPSAPIVAAAHTDHGGLVTSYIVAIGAVGRGRSISLPPRMLGYEGDVYAFNFFAKSGKLLHAAESIDLAPTGECIYWIFVPVGSSGIGFLGDAGKFVSNGRKRISRLADRGALSARIVLSRGEDRVCLHGYALRRPNLRVRGGKIENLFYDSSSRYFRFELVSSLGGSATITARTTKEWKRGRS